VAAGAGRLELCRFLLKRSTLFHEDEIINNARRVLFYNASAWHGDLDAFRFAEEVHNLFATEYGMVADADLENLTAIRYFCAGGNNNYGLSLLAQLPIATVPFADRFALAIESHNFWPTDFFGAVFHDDEWTMLATRANKAGKTALHWALDCYGPWENWQDSWESHNPSTNTSEIANGYALAVKLIRSGADIHACWVTNRFRRFGKPSKASPLLSFLRSATRGPGGRCLAAVLSDAVDRWGQMLVEAGISLQRYAAMENVFLRALRGAIDMQDGGREFVVAELGVLRVLGQDRLVVHVQSVCEVRMWKAKPIQVPGEWPAYPSLPSAINGLPEIPDTIIWTPEEHDQREGFRWVVVGNVSIKSPSYLVEPPRTIENHGKDSIDVTPPPRLDEHKRPLYDDDFSVITMEKDEEFRQRTRAYTRRRSASAPAVGSSERVGRHMFHFPGPWFGNVHKCATDVRWKLSGISCPSLRECLQGGCRDRTKEYPDRSCGWETWLMKDEKHIQVAKRFAERFCPHRLGVVEKTSAKAMERAQLAMGPARPPARSR
jgi:hypothetical protein